MVTDFTVVKDDPYAFLDAPTMGVFPRGRSMKALIFGSTKWESYLGSDEVPILANYTSHETAHLTLRKLGEHEANEALDDFRYPMKPDGTLDQEKQREMEIEENTGLELIIKALEHYSGPYSDRNKVVTNIYKGARQG